MSESPSSSPSAVKRACDACHRRKVKCIPSSEARACKNCHHSGLECTYNAIPQKKGPKGSRAKIISELRETQRHTHPTPVPTVTSTTAKPGSSGLVLPEVVTSAVDYFFANLYPTQPFLYKQQVTDMIELMDTDMETYCLMISLCAYVIIQSSMEVAPSAMASLDVRPQSSLHYGQILLNEAIRVRNALDYIESPSMWSIITSFFLFGCHFCLEKQNTAWYYLREATTLAQTCRMDQEGSYISTDLMEDARRRRLYWVLFITERAYALQQHRPLSLHNTIALPALDEDPTETLEVNGFLHLANLFKLLDDTFVGLRNKYQAGATASFVANLQQQLSDALPVYLQCTETQAVDLRCSQQWLRMMVWQLSIRHGFLSSAAPQEALSFHFPVEVSRELIIATTHFSQHSMEVHGIGLVEKLFDVACTLADVIFCVPYEQRPLEVGPRDYLNQLMTLIARLPGGQQRYIPLLVSKINDTVPRSTSVGFPTIPSISMPSALYLNRDSGSAQNSTITTPFGSPSLPAHTDSFGGYRREMMIGGISGATTFRHIAIEGVGFRDVDSHASVYGQSDSAVYSDGVVHSDSDTTGGDEESAR